MSHDDIKLVCKTLENIIIVPSLFCFIGIILRDIIRGIEKRKD